MRGVWDRGAVSVSVGSDYRCEGAHRPFRVVVFVRRVGRQPVRVSVRVPHVRFGVAVRLRRVGGVVLWRWQARALARLSA